MDTRRELHLGPLAAVGPELYAYRLGPTALNVRADATLVLDDEGRAVIRPRADLQLLIAGQDCSPGGQAARVHRARTGRYPAWFDPFGWSCIAGVVLGGGTRPGMVATTAGLHRIDYLSVGVGASQPGSLWHLSFMKAIGEGWGFVLSRRGFPVAPSPGQSTHPLSVVGEIGFLASTETDAESQRQISRGAVWVSLGVSAGVRAWGD